MTEDQTKEFLESMRRYAISRRGPPDAMDEFPTFAWEMIYVRKWKSSTKQLWSHFVRENLGTRESAKNEVESQIRFRKTDQLYDGKKIDYLENFIPAPEPDKQLSVDDTSLRTQMIACLAQSGFEVSEIFQAFDVKASRSRKVLRETQKELISSRKFQGAILKKGHGLKPYENRWRERLSLKKARASSVDAFSLIFGRSKGLG